MSPLSVQRDLTRWLLKVTSSSLKEESLSGTKRRLRGFLREGTGMDEAVKTLDCETKSSLGLDSTKGYTLYTRGSVAIVRS